MSINAVSKLAALAGLALVCSSALAGTTTFTLNGLEIGIDQDTGSIVRLGSSSTGELLKAEPESAGLLDLAYPIPEFVPMRLASRFSKARLVPEPNGVTIIWDRLGPSRSKFALPSGGVSAQVRIQSAGDGRSVIMTCRIENNSDAQVSQILFPDFQGLRAFEGPQRTRLRLARDVIYPFMAPIQPPDSSPWYVQRVGWKEYPAGGYAIANSLRWLDYGGFEAGLSVFQKRWGDGERPSILTNRTESDPDALRLCWQYKTPIKPGESWESDELWLTPHAGGWAKGIEVFRDYVNQVNPRRELPRHVSEGIGFRSGWMIQAPEPDPAEAAFRFSDIPRLAADASDPGIQEMVMWGVCQLFMMPIPVREELGTQNDLIEGIRVASKAGVNVAPFISIQWAVNESAEKYGAKPSASSYVYHPELIPNYTAYYLANSYPVHFWKAAQIPSNNKQWQADALAALREWLGWGISSFCYDVFDIASTKSGKPDLVTLVEQLRLEARAKDPQSTFSGESIRSGNLEHESPVLDYTWNWLDYNDAAPILNVLRSPRLNCNVESSARVVKKAFIDGLYINAQPRKPDQPNGTALIGDKPEMSAALKQCAKLRKQFLGYFVDGTFIGDSVLSEPSGGFVKGYQLGNRLLVIALNDADEQQQMVVKSDLALWLPPATGYEIKRYDSTGKLVDSVKSSGSDWVETTRPLQPLELALFEIEAL